MRESIDTRLQKGLDAQFHEEETTIIRKAKEQINEYLAGSKGELAGYAGGIRSKKKFHIQYDPGQRFRHTNENGE